MTYMISFFKGKIQGSKYVSDIFLQGSGNAIAQVIGVLTIPILTRLFTPEEYGVMSLFTNVVAFLSILITFRFEYLILLPKEDKVALNLLSIILRAGFVISLIVLIFIICNKSFIVSKIKLEEISKYLIFTPFTAFLMSTSVSVQQFQQRKQNYLLSGVSEIINKVGVFVFALGFFLIFRSTEALIFSASFGLFAKIIYLSYKDGLLKKSWNSFQKTIVLYSLRKYWKSSISFSVSNAVLAITGYLPIYFITNYYGMEVLGNWSLMIMALYLPTSVIGTAIGQVFYERAAKQNAAGLPFNALWLSTVKLLLIISIPCFLIISVLSPYLFTILFGEKWRLAGEYASIFSIAAGISFICTPLDRSCYIINQWKYPYFYNSLRLLFVIVILVIARKYSLTFKEFLWIHVSQTVLLYCFDLFMSFYFSCKTPMMRIVK
jgi:teichuronic acid exporter